MPIDMSTVTAPPRKSTKTIQGRATPVSKVPVQQSKKQIRQEGLMNLAQAGQAVCILFGQYADAATVGKFAEPLSGEIASICDEYDIVAGPVDFLIQIGPLSGLLAVLLPMGLQIAANHGAVDANRLATQGVVPPAVLEAQMQAQVMQMQAEAMAAQQNALREAQAAREELERMIQTQQQMATAGV